ncbi:E4 SUMO-protein ligase PIAL2-like [Wolffia australiana]
MASSTAAMAGMSSSPTMTREDIVRRVSYVVDRINRWMRCPNRKELSSLVQLCHSLARGIDFSVTVREVYPTAHDLPVIIKQVYKFKNEPSIQPAILLLLLSAKTACRQGWFSEADAKELIAMEKEMLSNFCVGSSFFDESKALSAISTVIKRFCPHLKFGKLIVSFGAKAGYNALVVDFAIPWNGLPRSLIRLLVVRTDENMETSSCLISPLDVNFLVNGRGVERRSSGFSDVGPQYPTNITRFLKYGTNLIQVVGLFSGEYIIAVASMENVQLSTIPLPQDYTSLGVGTEHQEDDDLIEGLSKISLLCPLSFRRIKTPVKGHLCKHHQCFCYENYMAMNVKRPAWRCPLCNQAVSFADLRVDRQMVKILAEAGEDATHVAIASNGSWKVLEWRGNAENAEGGIGQDESSNSKLRDPSIGLSHLVDLTNEPEEDFHSAPVPSYGTGMSTRTETIQPGQSQSQSQQRVDPNLRIWSLPPGIAPDPVMSEAVSPTLGSLDSLFMPPARQFSDGFLAQLQWAMPPQPAPRDVHAHGLRDTFSSGGMPLPSHSVAQTPEGMFAGSFLNQQPQNTSFLPTQLAMDQLPVLPSSASQLFFNFGTPQNSIWPRGS